MSNSSSPERPQETDVIVPDELSKYGLPRGNPISQKLYHVLEDQKKEQSEHDDSFHTVERYRYDESSLASSLSSSLHDETDLVNRSFVSEPTQQQLLSGDHSIAISTLQDGTLATGESSLQSGNEIEDHSIQGYPDQRHFNYDPHSPFNTGTPTALKVAQHDHSYAHPPSTSYPIAVKETPLQQEKIRRDKKPEKNQDFRKNETDRSSNRSSDRSTNSTGIPRLNQPTLTPHHPHPQQPAAQNDSESFTPELRVTPSYSTRLTPQQQPSYPIPSPKYHQQTHSSPTSPLSDSLNGKLGILQQYLKDNEPTTQPKPILRSERPHTPERSVDQLRIEAEMRRMESERRRAEEERREMEEERRMVEAQLRDAQQRRDQRQNEEKILQIEKEKEERERALFDLLSLQMTENKLIKQIVTQIVENEKKKQQPQTQTDVNRNESPLHPLPSAITVHPQSDTARAHDETATIHSTGTTTTSSTQSSHQNVIPINHFIPPTHSSYPNVHIQRQAPVVVVTRPPQSRTIPREERKPEREWVERRVVEEEWVEMRDGVREHDRKRSSTTSTIDTPRHQSSPVHHPASETVSPAQQKNRRVQFTDDDRQTTSLSGDKCSNCQKKKGPNTEPPEDRTKPTSQTTSILSESVSTPHSAKRSSQTHSPSRSNSRPRSSPSKSKTRRASKSPSRAKKGTTRNPTPLGRWTEERGRAREEAEKAKEEEEKKQAEAQRVKNLLKRMEEETKRMEQERKRLNEERKRLEKEKREVIKQREAEAQQKPKPKPKPKDKKEKYLQSLEFQPRMVAMDNERKRLTRSPSPSKTLKKKRSPSQEANPQSRSTDQKRGSPPAEKRDEQTVEAAPPQPEQSRSQPTFDFEQRLIDELLRREDELVELREAMQRQTLRRSRDEQPPLPRLSILPHRGMDSDELTGGKENAQTQHQAPDPKGESHLPKDPHLKPTSQQHPPAQPQPSPLPTQPSSLSPPSQRSTLPTSGTTHQTQSSTQSPTQSSTQSPTQSLTQPSPPLDRQHNHQRESPEQQPKDERRPRPAQPLEDQPSKPTSPSTPQSSHQTLTNRTSSTTSHRSSIQSNSPQLHKTKESSTITGSPIDKSTKQSSPKVSSEHELPLLPLFSETHGTFQLSASKIESYSFCAPLPPSDKEAMKQSLQSFELNYIPSDVLNSMIDAIS
ncbi:hypothetical protein BLNAU_873 [Blattamonas nauphoetae]|uniref:Uncharacterized protein n=1 Tax=Blattamonas nauphoetae TaxID=2049346 RepID=A0ABQ9YKR5_9EUKA|nr:hypothetical protein BLNAU_873 [Blattamonas nauphoetae]